MDAEKKTIVRGGVRWPFSVWQQLEQVARQRSLRPMQVVRDIVTEHFMRTDNLNSRVEQVERDIQEIRESFIPHYSLKPKGPRRRAAS
jgi:predicted DNA-binding ribbon-helix-helix protein